MIYEHINNAMQEQQQQQQRWTLEVGKVEQNQVARVSGTVHLNTYKIPVNLCKRYAMHTTVTLVPVPKREDAVGTKTTSTSTSTG